MAASASVAVFGKLLADLRGDGRVVPERGPEIAVRDAHQERAVLRHQRPVEPERVPQLEHFLLRRTVAEHCLRRIARDEVDQREHERRHAEHHGDRQEEAADEVARHS